MGLLDTIVSRISHKGHIVHKAQLSAHAYHIRIQSDNFATAEYVPGYFLRVFCGYGQEVSLGDKIRSYSVWNLNRESRSVDMAVCTHSDGPGTRWAQNARVGDTVYFSWHKGKFTADAGADGYLFIGDLSALAHLYEINRNLPAGKPRQGIIYAENQTDFFADINGQWPFALHVLPQNPIEALVQEINTLHPQLMSRSTVYIGGDSRVCVALNAYFKKELGWETRQIKNKPFWNPAKKGLE